MESKRDSLLEGRLTEILIRLFYRVYDILGHGFMEAVYCDAFAIELEAEGIGFVREALVDVWYKGRRLRQFKVDFLVEGRVMAEMKAVDVLAYAHRQKLRNYLSASKLEVGMLFNFGPKARFERMIHTNDRK